MTAKLTWPFLGYYGPQSGVTFDERPELNDYAETEEEMLALMRLAGKIDRFDIAQSMDLNSFTGVAEIIEYIRAASNMVGTKVTGYIGDTAYTIDCTGDKWMLTKGDGLCCVGSPHQCIEVLIL